MIGVEFGAFGRNLRTNSVAELDAAAPLFISEGLVLSEDNVFLEVIQTSVSDGYHTKDAKELLGIDCNFGHLDFYPNGGRRQLGCSECKLNSSRESLFMFSIYHIFSN